MSQPGPYDACPCGSGKKYKFCCARHNKPVLLPGSPAPVALIVAVQTGMRHFERGHLVLAEAVFRQILLHEPEHFGTLQHLGLIAQRAGQHSAAIRWFELAQRGAPEPQLVHFNLGVSYFSLGNSDAAAECFRRAIDLDAGYAQAHSNLGAALGFQGQYGQAVSCFQRALACQPDYRDAHANLGAVLLALGDYGAALESFQAALRLAPGNAEIMRQLGVAMKAMGQVGQAAEVLQGAVAADPASTAVLSDLGATYLALGDAQAAQDTFRRVLQLDPANAAAHSAALFSMQFLVSLTPHACFEAHLEFAQRFEAPLRGSWPAHENIPDPARVLRIGYVSGDFKSHSVAYFIGPILRSHDKSKFRIYCYANSTTHDAVSAQMQAQADCWVPCLRMSDAQLFERIRADQIDILIDLSGHTADNRLPVFARKPAPLQATWIGYADTTGLSAMDYRLTDRFMDPPGMTERYHSETLLRLPETSAAYQSDPLAPPVNSLPALASGRITFGSLNNLSKLNLSVVRLWSRILAAIPNSSILIGDVSDAGMQARVMALFEAAGVDSHRVELKPRVPMAQFLGLHQKIDVALDTFPYNGGTTSMHALWMGVPVVTLAGQRSMSRAGASVLGKVGLEHLVAQTEDEYVQCAVDLVKDLEALNRLRQSLRDRIATSRNDPASITRQLEDLYTEIWRNWCSSRG